MMPKPGCAGRAASEPRERDLFKKIVIANRGEGVRNAGVSEKPECLLREARAGDLAPMEPNRV